MFPDIITVSISMHGKQMIGTGCEIDKETSKVHTLNSAAKNAAYIGIEADDLNPKRNRGMLLLEENNNKYQINNST
jgi:hypothetical protein